MPGLFREVSTFGVEFTCQFLTLAVFHGRAVFLQFLSTGLQIFF